MLSNSELRHSSKYMLCGCTCSGTESSVLLHQSCRVQLQHADAFTTSHFRGHLWKFHSLHLCFLFIDNLAWNFTQQKSIHQVCQNNKRLIQGVLTRIAEWKYQTKWSFEVISETGWFSKKFYLINIYAILVFKGRKRPIFSFKPHKKMFQAKPSSVYCKKIG